MKKTRDIGKAEKSKEVRSIHCMHCYGGFDEKSAETVGNRARMTDWQPAPGLDPRLREFQCEHCRKMTYKVMPPRESQKEPEE